MADYLRHEEDTGHYTLEDNSGALLLEEQPVGLQTGECGIELEATTDLLELENADGLVLLEACPVAATTAGGGRTRPQRQPEGKPLRLVPRRAVILIHAWRPTVMIGLITTSPGLRANASTATPRIRMKPCAAKGRANYRAMRDQTSTDQDIELIITLEA